MNRRCELASSMALIFLVSPRNESQQCKGKGGESVGRGCRLLVKVVGLQGGVIKMKARSTDILLVYILLHGRVTDNFRLFK